MIHLVRVPSGVCEGKDAYEPQREAAIKEMIQAGKNGLVYTEEKVAGYSANVDCKRCLQWLKASKARRAKMVR